MNKKKKFMIRRLFLGIFLLIIVIIIGFLAYSFLHSSNKKVPKNVNTNITNSNSTTNINSTSTTSNQNKIIQGNNIIESAKSYAVPANQVAQILAGHSNLKTKEVFLTFDDGPSQNSEEILKILKENDVHATFFILGSQLANNPQMQQVVKDEIYQGNAIANHSYSHDYKKLYPNNVLNISNTMNEINETNKILQNILCSDFDARVLRLPGGYMSRYYYKDPNLSLFNKTLDDAHITSIDWDAETGDATTGGQVSTQTLVNNAMNHINNLNQPVILMHDSSTKKDTVEALPYLIKALKDKGYKFMVIENAPISSFDNLPYTTTTGSNQGQGTLN